MRRHIKSFREYLDILNKQGDLQKYSQEVDPHLEIGAISRYVIEQRLPMAVMDNIKGYPGYSMTTGVLACSSFFTHPYSRMATALGFDPFIHPLEMIKELGGFSHEKRVKPVKVNSPGFMKNVIEGDKVDLFNIPCPYLHQGDGGDYLNTIGTMVVKTPDNRWTNWHICRVMRVDKNHLTVWTRQHQHFAMIHEEWKKLNKKMPFAIALAPEPAVTAISGIRVPAEVDEADVLGGWFGEGIEVATSPGGKLDVPASCEMVIEGEMSIDTLHEEGPFGEYHGYLLADKCNELVGEVLTIAHVDKPVIGTIPAGKPLDDDHAIIGIGGSSTFTLALKEAGMPVLDAWMAPETALHLLVVRVKPEWQQQYKNVHEFIDALEAAILSSPMSYVIAHALVIDTDIDPTHPGDVLWAWSSRVHPETGTRITKPRYITDMPPVFTPAERKIHQARLAIHVGLLGANPNSAKDPVLPCGFNTLYPQELKEKVIAAFSSQTSRRKA